MHVTTVHIQTSIMKDVCVPATARSHPCQLAFRSCPKGAESSTLRQTSGSASRPAHVSVLAGTHRCKGHRCEGYCSQNILSSITNSGCAKMTSALASPSVHAGCKSRTARNRENEANPWGVALQTCHENIQELPAWQMDTRDSEGEQNCNKP